ncbi:MAG: hypothetical protein R6V07_01965 [Armatimonadota bacterium]
MTTDTRDKQRSEATALPSRLGDLVRSISRQDPGFGGRLRKRLDRVMQAHDAEGPDASLGDLERDVITQTQNAELFETVFEFYSLREQYLRHADAIDSKVKDLSRWASEHAEQMLLSFVRAQMDKARADIRTGSKWYTGAQQIASDTWSVVKWADKTLDDKLDGKKPTRERPKYKSFFEKNVSKHFNEEMVRSFTEKLGAELDEQLGERWAENARSVEREASRAFSKMAARNVFAASSLRDVGLDDGTKTALIGLGAAATSTAVLAAGWHTLAWSLGGMFLPLMPVVAVATVAVAMFRQGAEVKKMMKALDAYQQSLEQALRDNVRYRIRTELDAVNRARANDIKRAVFERYIGTFERSLFEQLIRTLEDWGSELLAAGESVEDSTRDPATGERWTSLAREALDRGDDLPAAMYCALAFEQLLRDLNRKLRVHFNFRVPHHNRAFIDTLEDRQLLSPDQISRLHSLKRSRDTFTHRMHLLASMSEARRGKAIRNFIDQLEELGSQHER